MKASHGTFDALAEADGAGLDDVARKAWARAKLLEWVDGQVAELEEHYETLDHRTIEQDRAEAGDRALFDASKPAALARRYEAEARRGFFRALDQFPGPGPAQVETKAPEPSAASPAIEAVSTPLASSCDESSPEPDEEATRAERPGDRAITGPVEGDRGVESRPTTPDRAIPRPS